MGKLRGENDSEVLTDSIDRLAHVVIQKDLRGRKDISDLVKETVGRIPEKDERSFVEKILGGNSQSRRERLGKIAKEIEEKTR